MRVGVVLGVGGIMGGAWLAGAVQAIADETGWDPGSADHLVGTSAGSITATLLAAGVPAGSVADFYRRDILGHLPDGELRELEAVEAKGGRYTPHRGVPIPGPGSWRLALDGMMRPWRYRPAALLAGWLPRGVISHEPLRDAVRSAGPAAWPEHPLLWIVGCDYSTGRRVVFGREGAPTVEVADAVTASCAVPGFYHPITIEGRRYVDGGVWSASNLDVLHDQPLDFVLCLNPTSSLEDLTSSGPRDLLSATWRRISGRRLGWEAKRLRAAGKEVALIQPVKEDLAAMGPNMMRRTGVGRVIEVARQTTAEQLRRPGASHTLLALGRQQGAKRRAAGAG